MVLPIRPVKCVTHPSGLYPGAFRRWPRISAFLLLLAVLPLVVVGIEAFAQALGMHPSFKASDLPPKLVHVNVSPSVQDEHV